MNALQATPVGYVPTDGALRLDGLREDVNMRELFYLPQDFWLNECEEIGQYLSDQVGDDLPDEIGKQLAELKERVAAQNAKAKVAQNV